MVARAEVKNKAVHMGASVGEFGLRQYCNTLVEEFEDAIVGEMVSAKEMTGSAGYGIPGMSRYSMVQALCVRATPSCSPESLNQISQQRLAMGLKNSDARKSVQRLLEEMGESKASGTPDSLQGGSEQPPRKAEKAPKAPTAPQASKARKPRESTREADEPPKGLFKLVASLRALVAHSPMVVLASGLTVTTTAVYVGGMVARVW